MEVHQLEAGLHLGGAELFDGEEDFSGVESKLGVVAAGHGPLAFAAGLELHPEADHGLHARFLGDGDDAVDLGELLDYDDDLFAQLAAEEGEPHVIVVLVTIANDQALGVLMHGQGDH